MRLYESRGENFYWDSWVIANGQADYVAIRSPVLAYALDNPAFEQPHFDAHKANTREREFREYIDAKQVEDIKSS